MSDSERIVQAVIQTSKLNKIPFNQLPKVTRDGSILSHKIKILGNMKRKNEKKDGFSIPIEIKRAEKELNCNLIDDQKIS